MGNPEGRPSLYKPEYCEKLIEHMSSGLSFETFGASIDVCRATVFNWVNEHPEFLDAKKKAFDKCQIFWEKIGVEGIWDTKEKSLNTGNYVFQMKNRFKWNDRVEHSFEDVKPILFAYDPDKEIPEK